MGVCIFYMKDRANEIYKKVEDQKPLRGRNQDAILAACLYIACRQEDKPRTVKGMTSLLTSLYLLASFLTFSQFLDSVDIDQKFVRCPMEPQRKKLAVQKSIL